jgi:hypothetical protein
MVMRRLALSLLFAVTLSAAPITKDKEADLYLPIKVGAKRVYLHGNGTLKTEIIETVTKLEGNDGTYRVTIEANVSNGNRSSRVYEVSAKEIKWLKSGDEQINPPIVQLKLPAKIGDTWLVDSKKGDEPFLKTTYKVIKVDEEIEVLAGKFKTICVESTTDSKGLEIKGKTWYALGIGGIKSEMRYKEETPLLWELTSYTSGK